MVVNELRGEKIDVVPWSDNSAEFVANALQPAKVKEVRIDESTGTAMVIVPDYQLSLAIGKEGQNARLAARLTGWRIDIKSETQVADEARGRRAAAPANRHATVPVPAKPCQACRGHGRPAPSLEPAPPRGSRGAGHGVSVVAREPIRTLWCRERGKSTRAVSPRLRPEIDRSGTVPGRGAYVHPDPACVMGASRSGVLGRALRTGLDGDEVGRVMDEIERMGAA
jgi:predicted RNA-binding protein YlxR (DUF448 family)